MSFLGWLFLMLVLAVIAFAAYYQFILRALHIELRAREIHTIQTRDGWRIRLFRYRKGGSSGEPVLLVHGYTSNHWNLTLPQGESLADYLVEQGYDCWAIDLRGNRTSIPPPGTPRHRATYDGYVMGDLPAAIAFIRQSTGFDQVHWVGHSMGGMLLYAYELAHGRDRIASGTTIASPPWLEAFWSKSQDRLVWFMETLPWVFEIGKRSIAPGYAALKPNHRLVPVRWENLSPRFGVAEFFNAAEQSSGPVTRTFEECAKHRYLAVDNDRVNVLTGLTRLETPLLVMGCPLDPIAPISNLRQFFDRLPSQDKRFIELSKEAGCEMDHSHVDPPFAKNAAAEVFAPIAEWIAAHPAQRSDTAKAPTISVPVAAVAESSMADTPKSWPVKPAHEPEDSTLWGKALKDAASILSGLDGESTPAVTPSQTRKPARKPSTKSRATAKASAKEKVSTKAKKVASATAAKTGKPSPAGTSPTNTKTKPVRENGVDRASAKPRKRSTKAKSGRMRGTGEPQSE